MTVDLEYTGERFIPGEDGPGIHLEHLHRYGVARALVSGQVLDLACGAGYGSEMLAQQASRVVAIDRSLPAIRYAEGRFTSESVIHAAADAGAIPFPDATFDWVVAFEILEHLDEPNALLDEALRVLKPQGALILSTPNRPTYSEARGYSNPFHRHEFNLEELDANLRERFPWVQYFGQQLVAGSRLEAIEDAGGPSSLSRVSVSSVLLGSFAPPLSPTYLIAIGSRHELPPDLVERVGSVLEGALDSFLDERTGRILEQERQTHTAYEQEISRLRSELEGAYTRVQDIGRRLEESVREPGPGSRRRRSQSLEALGEDRVPGESPEATIVRLQASRSQIMGERWSLQQEVRRLERFQGRRERVQGELRDRVVALERELQRADRSVQILRAERRASEARAATAEQARHEAERRCQVIQEAHAAEHAESIAPLLLRRLELETQLEAIRTSRTWRVWMLSIATRKVLLPWRWNEESAALARRSLKALGRALKKLMWAPPHACGWLVLAAGTLFEWLRAGLRRRRTPFLTEPEAVPPRASSSATRERPRVLLVSPYPIYPPDHGGGVRLYNLIRRVASQVDLYLFIFIRSDDDPAQRAALEPYSREVYFHYWQPRLKPTFWGLKPSSAQLFESEEVAERLQAIVSEKKIDILQLEYTELGQYAFRVQAPKTTLTEIDITFRSRMRRRAAGFHRKFKHDRVFGFSLGDWMRQFLYELRCCRRVDRVIVMSETDGACLAPYLPRPERTLTVVPNAVDTEAFQPTDSNGERNDVLFVGNFHHLPNLDAFHFLIEEIWPRIRELAPDTHLTVVGAYPPEQVLAWDGRNGVTVRGTVPDVVPYYQQHQVLLAPIRAGSGTRLKILEAMASGLPVVSTTIGAEGIECIPGTHLLVADLGSDLAQAVVRLLERPEEATEIARAALELARRRYDWSGGATTLLGCYQALTSGERSLGVERTSRQTSEEVKDVEERPRASPRGLPTISVVIPTRNGGELLGASLEAILKQEINLPFEVLCIDSGSQRESLEVMRRYPVTIESIPPEEFDHGLTRDRGAELARGQVLVFLNQDAVPFDRSWLRGLTAPLLEDDPTLAAVQGGIREFEDTVRRFFWDSCGGRFYFTRESHRWIARYDGIGFSTVNAAIRRSVWEGYPFGQAAIMEDKKWQRTIVEAGYRIDSAPTAAVLHSHDYDLHSLVRRCQSEGFGWRQVGERYSVFDMLRDMLRPRMYADLTRGLAQRRVRSFAEVSFPWLRPVLVYWGNRWASRVRL